MLQRTQSPSTVPSAADVVSPAELIASFRELLRRQYPIILTVALLVVGLGFVHLFTAPTRFTASASLIIDTRKVQLFQQQSVLGDIPVDTSMVDSQVEILRSENVALSVIKDLHLTDDPEFLAPPTDFFGSLLGFVRRIFVSNTPPSELELTRRVVNGFENQLDIKRVGLTYVMGIEFRSLSPERAAQIANAVAEAYIVDQLEAKYQAARRAGIWLQDRIKELREQATTAERAVVDFKIKNNIVDSTNGRLMNEQQLAELNSQLVLTRTQLAEAKARLGRIDEIIRMEVPDGTVTDTLRNEVINKLRSQYLDFSRREADFSTRYGKNHLAAVNLRNQMAEIRRNIVDELHRIAQTYQSDYEIAKAREDSITRSLAETVSISQTTNQAQIALRELESSAQTYRALHDNFLQRYMESIQQQSFPITEARLITMASPPLKKSHPKRLLVLAISASLGAILGLGLGLLRDLSDRVFRTSSQVENLLQTDCLSVVPAVKGEITRTASEREADEPRGPRTIVRDNSVFWAAIDAPFSRFAESIRAIKVAADLNNPGKPTKVIAITSSLPNEGKSTIAMALAQIIANSGRRAILVDCDLRNPALSRKLAPTAQAGVLEAAADGALLKEVLWMDHSTGLFFLPAVIKTKFAHTSEVLAAIETKQLFESLNRVFDYVVIDLSPIAPVVDVRTVTHVVDGFVFVVEWGRTKIDVVEHALHEARGVYENLLGVILNKVDFQILGRYENRGSYYHNRHYARYGYTE
jgi:polysaccharide biosynthesis transport protein